ncbi:TIR domain-containing protein [Methyloglobulus sp.]|uniref:TIR domain-containing protein n=1 Tax=Methyloglobulus sp. TaxID=2518622 RepID=UPI00398981BE
MKKPKHQIFISYSGHDKFEAELLQFAVEKSLGNDIVSAWTFQRDQKRSEKEIANSLKTKVKESVATIFLVSPNTLESGATQWMELAYSDAFEVETFVLLHHISYGELKSRDSGIPPLLLSSQCNDATDWKSVVSEIGQIISAEGN